jgi:hypothetical protein
MQRLAKVLTAAAVISALVPAGGCATAAPRQRPATGNLTVGVTASGGPAATLKLRIEIQPAGTVATVKADAGVFTDDSMPFGEHVVRLRDLPASCRVEGGVERTVVLTAQNRLAIVRFDVRCD